MNPQNIPLSSFFDAVKNEKVDPPLASEVSAIANMCQAAPGIYVGGGYGRLIPALMNAGVRFSCILEPHPEHYEALTGRFPHLPIKKLEIGDYDGPESMWSILPYGTFNMFSFEEQWVILRSMLLHSRRAIIDVVAEPYYTKRTISGYRTTGGMVAGYYVPVKKYKDYATRQGLSFSAIKYIFSYREVRILFWTRRIPVYHWIITFSRS